VLRQGAEAIGRLFAEHVVSGSGSGQPGGLDLATTVTTTSAAIDAWTADELIDVYHAITPGYRRGATWLMADATVAAVRKLKDGSGQYLWQPGLTAGAPDTLLGRPLRESVSVQALGTANESVIFANVARAGVAYMAGGGLHVDSSVDYAFNTDLITTRFVMRAGFELVDELAVSVGVNA
jgi:HK97 family phage major capsid protein